jgi:tRNA/tmRNA/rRNA uracil-C5-methylase (TrmA/RlmC/RlmD family)
VDLFGGNGNLSEELSFEHRFVIDNNLHNLPSDTKTTYLSKNLYSESTYDFGKLGQVDGIILDPPRSGFPPLKKWIDTLKPQWVLYVSCDYHKSLRDLKELGEQVKEIKILDFFPSTYHLEAMFKLKFYS